MANVVINDLNLLRYSYEKISGKDASKVAEFQKKFPSDKYVCLGEYRSDGEPFWAVTLHSFKEGHDCYLDIAINPRGLLHPRVFERIARVVFDYVFNQSKLKRCTVEIRESNKKSLRMALAWGFMPEGVKRKGYCDPIENKCLLGLLKEECMWI